MSLSHIFGALPTPAEWNWVCLCMWVQHMFSFISLYQLSSLLPISSFRQLLHDDETYFFCQFNNLNLYQRADSARVNNSNYTNRNFKQKDFNSNMIIAICLCGLLFTASSTCQFTWFDIRKHTVRKHYLADLMNKHYIFSWQCNWYGNECETGCNMIHRKGVCEATERCNICIDVTKAQGRKIAREPWHYNLMRFYDTNIHKNH